MADLLTSTSSWSSTTRPRSTARSTRRMPAARGGRQSAAASCRAQAYPALRQRGQAKNKRSDVPQIVVGLAMTRDGLPVRAWVFRGNTVDVKTVAQVKADLRGWKLTPRVFVGDAGMVSEANLEALGPGGGKYILCMPIKRGTRSRKRCSPGPAATSRWPRTSRSRRSWSGTGSGGGATWSASTAGSRAAARAPRAGRWPSSRPCSRADHPGAGSPTASGPASSGPASGTASTCSPDRPPRDRPRQGAAAERLDGKFVVHSNDDTLTPSDLALGYKQLQQVERAWRLLKSGLRIRPIFHWAPHRIRAHVSLTMLALLLERLAENACGDTWRNIRDDLRQIKLAQFLTPKGSVWQVTEPSPAAANRLKALKIPKPPPILDLA